MRPGPAISAIDDSAFYSAIHDIAAVIAARLRDEKSYRPAMEDSAADVLHLTDGGSVMDQLS